MLAFTSSLTDIEDALVIPMSRAQRRAQKTRDAKAKKKERPPKATQLRKPTGVSAPPKPKPKNKKSAAPPSKPKPVRPSAKDIRKREEARLEKRLSTLQESITAKELDLAGVYNATGNINEEYNDRRKQRRKLGKNKDKTPHLNKPRVADLKEGLTERPSPIAAEASLEEKIQAAELQAAWLDARIKTQESINDRLEDPLKEFRQARATVLKEVGTNQQGRPQSHSLHR